MSSFTCPECDTRIIETERGYVTECEHFPSSEMNAPQAARKKMNAGFKYEFVRDESGELIPEVPALIKWYQRRKSEKRNRD